MTIEQYNCLPDKQRKALLVDAEKIYEFEDDTETHELFQIDNFFVEVSKSVTYKFRKILNTYSVDNIPVSYADVITADIIHR